MTLTIVAVTNDLAFDYFFSVVLNVFWVFAPMLLALTLLSSRR